MGNACESYCAYEEQNQLHLMSHKTEFMTEKYQSVYASSMSHSSLSAVKKSRKTMPNNKLQSMFFSLVEL